MTRHWRALALLAVLVLVTAACGGRSEPKADRTVEVTMEDNAPFQPSQLQVPVGTTVNFVFHNETEHTHEAVVGDQAFQDKHEQEMEHQPHMPMKKSRDFVEVHAGETDNLVYKFDKPGTFIIGCHQQPDHFDRGEKMTVTVV